MSSSVRANSFSRKSFKSSLTAHKSDGELLKHRMPGAPKPPPPNQTLHANSGAKSALQKRMSRVMSSRKHSMQSSDTIGEEKFFATPREYSNSDGNDIATPMAPVRGRSELEPAISAAGGKSHTTSKGRNVSFMHDDSDEMRRQHLDDGGMAFLFNVAYMN